MKNKFAVCLNCMDGRIQLPVIQWIKKHYEVDFVDMITEPGMDGVLAELNSDINDIVTKLEISVDKHGSQYIFIGGHYDCLGHPVDNETHKKDVMVAVERIKKLKSSCKVIGLWISNKLSVQKITEM
ncbi:MAG: carbonic anhydrase [Methanobacteriaceae archaeon]|nr:carbonic anhydrase [Methanobacteriaceae archaeon]